MELEFDLKDNKKFGNKTVKMSSKELNAEVEFKNAVEDEVVYESKGNDIIITAYGQKDGIVDTKTVLGKITIKNAGTKEVVENGSVELEINNIETELLYETYKIGDITSKKKQTIKGSYLNNDIYGGSGNDTIYAVGGYNTITAGQGADKIYAGEKKDIIWINKGDAVNGDTIYNATSEDDLSFDYGENSSDEVATIFTKTGNDLVISVGEKGGDLDNVKIDKFFTAEDTINGFNEMFKESGLDIYTFGSDAIYKNGEETDSKISQFGNEKKANTLIGTKYGDLIVGGDKADKITTGTGDDAIIAGKGNDTITIDGYGQKTVSLGKGDGNDTIMYVNPTETPKKVSTALNVNFATSEDESITYSYNKSFTDLTITATREDGKSESVTLKGYYNPIQGTPDTDSTPMGYTTVNEELVSDKLNLATTTIGSAKVSDLLKVLKNEYGVELPAGIKVPKDLGAINVHLGSIYDDEFKGTTGKDVMATFGGNNEFTTGSKGQTVIASLGKSHDNYNVSSFTAGTVIYDADSDYDLLVNNVDTNDIHMVALNNAFGSPINAQYMTDKTGITNLAGIDYKGIYDKVINVVNALDSGDEKKAISAINTAVSAVPGIINKFRGVATVSINPESEVIKPLAYDDVYITDKKGNKQIIAGKDIALLSQATSQATWEYLNYVNTKYSEIVGEEFEDITEVAGYLLNPKGGEKLSKAEQKAYNDIKAELFNTFKKLYIGTDGDNTYAISKSEGFNAYVSGFGNDTFTFKGDVGTKWVSGVYNRDAEYVISSDYKAGQKDTLSFTGYASNEMWLNSYFDKEESVVLKNIHFSLDKYSKNTFASVSYNVNADANGYGGYDLSEGDFELTIKDSKLTYDYLAAMSETSLTVDKSGKKTNNILNTFAKDVTIKSSSGTNKIEAETINATLESHGSVNYTYGNGKDEVIAFSDYSDGTYNVDLTNKTTLSIYDGGYNDSDDLVVSTNKLNDVRLFVNIYNDGLVDTSNVYLAQTGDLKKSSFVVATSSGYSTKSSSSSSKYAYFDKGIDFNYNYDSSVDSDGIETVNINKNDIDVKTVIDQLNSEVQGWFEASGKDYYSVNDVIANGTTKEVNSILAIYNNIDLSQYIA